MNILEISINDIPFRRDDNFYQKIYGVKFYSGNMVQYFGSTNRFFELGKLKKLYVDENNFLHREDGPALIGSEITCWYSHGRLHRDNDEPAKIWSSYIGSWCGYFYHGKLHRENGPAVIFKRLSSVTDLKYYLNGEEVPEKYFIRRDNLKILLS